MTCGSRETRAEAGQSRAPSLPCCMASSAFSLSGSVPSCELGQEPLPGSTAGTEHLLVEARASSPFSLPDPRIRPAWAHKGFLLSPVKVFPPCAGPQHSCSFWVQASGWRADCTALGRSAVPGKRPQGTGSMTSHSCNYSNQLTPDPPGYF